MIIVLKIAIVLILISAPLPMLLSYYADFKDSLYLFNENKEAEDLIQAISTFGMIIAIILLLFCCGWVVINALKFSTI